MKNPDELIKANNQLEEEYRIKCNQLNETRTNDYKAKHCPNCGRKIEYVEELCNQ